VVEGDPHKGREGNINGGKYCDGELMELYMYQLPFLRVRATSLTIIKWHS
jgi:hypothetical protein